MPEPVKNNGKIDFEELFKTYYDKLCIHAEKIVVDKEAAKDIVSNFFLKLMENIENIHISISPWAYLRKGVTNECIKYLDHVGVMRRGDQSMSDNSDLFQTLDNNDPLAMLISQETLTEIEKAIDTLPAQCKEVFILAQKEGLSYHEIAEKTGLSEGTIGVQINRAKKKLRETLGNIG